MSRCIKEVVRSKWILIKSTDGGYTSYLQCSNCSAVVVQHTGDINDCPHCGAKNGQIGGKNERLDN